MITPKKLSLRVTYVALQYSLATYLLLLCFVCLVPSPGIFFNPPSPILEYVVGDPLTIECMVTTVPGVSTVSIIWTVLGGDIIMNNSRMIITPTNSRGSNFTSNLQFEYLTEGDSNQYTCNVMIQETNASESFGLYGTTGRFLLFDDCYILCKISTTVCVYIVM